MSERFEQTLGSLVVYRMDSSSEWARERLRLLGLEPDVVVTSRLPVLPLVAGIRDPT